MKKLFQIWTKEPYGRWEATLVKPVSEKEAESSADLLRAGGRPLKVIVLEKGESPEGKE